MMGAGESEVKKRCQWICLPILLIIFGCERPNLTGVEFEKIDTSQDPRQTPYTTRETISRRIKGGSVSITSQAEYKISGVVVSRKSYSDDWGGEISPVDLAIAWGRLADPDSDRYVTFGHGYRWYRYRWKEEGPFNGSDIITHSSNNHTIPAGENVGRALKAIRRGGRIVLEGYLVNLKGIYKGREVSWVTSLSRKDTGNGSCELFYVSKVRIDTKVYE